MSDRITVASNTDRTFLILRHDVEQGTEELRLGELRIYTRVGLGDASHAHHGAVVEQRGVPVLGALLELGHAGVVRVLAVPGRVGNVVFVHPGRQDVVELNHVDLVNRLGTPRLS